MFIEGEAKGNAYKELIDLAFDICDTFVLVVRKDVYHNQHVDYVLEALEGSLIEVNAQYQWPGTTLFGGEAAEVYYYKTDSRARDWKAYANRRFKDQVIKAKDSS